MTNFFKLKSRGEYPQEMISNDTLLEFSSAIKCVFSKDFQSFHQICDMCDYEEILENIS